MFDYSVWAVAILLELALVVRSVRGDYFKRYPIFYSYISFVFLQSILRLAIYRLEPDWYRSVYWFTEFVGIIAGCSVVFEFCCLCFKGYPGVVKMARAALLLAFLFTFSKVLFTAAEGAEGWTPALTVLLVRDVRFVQVAATLILVAVVLVYGIPMSRNLKGIILGYGLYLSLVVLNLTYLSVFGERVQFIVTKIQACSYLLALLAWNVALWSYRPTEGRAFVAQKSYSAICEETNEQLARTKNSVESVLP
jgi:hypothetical protein